MSICSIFFLSVVYLQFSVPIGCQICNTLYLLVVYLQYTVPITPQIQFQAGDTISLTTPIGACIPYSTTSTVKYYYTSDPVDTTVGSVIATFNSVDRNYSFRAIYYSAWIDSYILHYVTRAIYYTALWCINYIIVEI